MSLSFSPSRPPLTAHFLFPLILLRFSLLSLSLPFHSSASSVGSSKFLSSAEQFARDDYADSAEHFDSLLLGTEGDGGGRTNGVPEGAEEAQMVLDGTADEASGSAAEEEEQREDGEDRDEKEEEAEEKVIIPTNGRKRGREKGEGKDEERKRVTEKKESCEEEEEKEEGITHPNGRKEGRNGSERDEQEKRGGKEKKGKDQEKGKAEDKHISKEKEGIAGGGRENGRKGVGDGEEERRTHSFGRVKEDDGSENRTKTERESSRETDRGQLNTINSAEGSKSGNGTTDGQNAATERCHPKLDMVFLLDTSGSIEQLYREHVRWAVSLVESLPLERDTVRVAAVQYAGFPLTEFVLGTYPSAEDIRQHFRRMKFQAGGTRTGYALRKAESELFRPDRGARAEAGKIIVLFTDGLSIDDPLKPAKQLREHKNVKIFIVSIFDDALPFHAELNKISGKEENIFGPGPEELERLRAALLTEAERAQACIRIGDQLPFHGTIGGHFADRITDDQQRMEVERVGGERSRAAETAPAEGGDGRETEKEREKGKEKKEVEKRKEEQGGRREEKGEEKGQESVKREEKEEKKKEEVKRMEEESGKWGNEGEKEEDGKEEEDNGSEKENDREEERKEKGRGQMEKKEEEEKNEQEEEKKRREKAEEKNKEEEEKRREETDGTKSKKEDGMGRTETDELEEEEKKREEEKRKEGEKGNGTKREEEKEEINRRKEAKEKIEKNGTKKENWTLSAEEEKQQQEEKEIRIEKEKQREEKGTVPMTTTAKVIILQRDRERKAKKWHRKRDKFLLESDWPTPFPSDHSSSSSSSPVVRSSPSPSSSPRLPLSFSSSNSSIVFTESPPIFQNLSKGGRFWENQTDQNAIIKESSSSAEQLQSIDADEQKRRQSDQKEGKEIKKKKGMEKKEEEEEEEERKEKEKKKKNDEDKEEKEKGGKGEGEEEGKEMEKIKEEKEKLMNEDENEEKKEWKEKEKQEEEKEEREKVEGDEEEEKEHNEKQGKEGGKGDREEKRSGEKEEKQSQNRTLEGAPDNGEEKPTNKNVRGDAKVERNHTETKPSTTEQNRQGQKHHFGNLSPRNETTAESSTICDIASSTDCGHENGQKEKLFRGAGGDGTAREEIKDQRDGTAQSETDNGPDTDQSVTVPSMTTENASFSSLSSVERADDVFEVPAEEEKNEQKEREGEKEKEKETEKATEGTTRNWSSSDGPSADPPLASDESAPFSPMPNATVPEELLIRPTPTEISSAEAENSTAKAEDEAKEREKSGKRMKLGRRKEWRKNEAKRKAFGVVTNQKQTVYCPSLDVLFIVDSSGSVQRVYEEQKRWLEEILCQIQLEEPEKGPQVALIQFAGAELQKTEWGWNRFRNSEQMMDAFHQVRHLTGTTFIGRALQQAAILLERRRRPVPALVVLLSDGFSQDEAFESAQNLRSMANIQFFALSISELSNTEYLHRLTANPSHVFIGTTGAALLRAQILRRIRCGA